MLMPQAMEKKETMEGSAFMRKKHREHLQQGPDPASIITGLADRKKSAEAPQLIQYHFLSKGSSI
jgi:hypothetical protein